MSDSTAAAKLQVVLIEAQTRRLLGATPIERQVAHALAFSSALTTTPKRVVDLGSGGGLPGLVLGVLAWPAAQVVLVDSQQRRANFLAWASEQLGCAGRIVARHDRAEDLGRDPQLRGTFDVAVARSFAKPPITAECGAPLLQVGGHLVVSDPPVPTPGRWPAEELGELGLAVEHHVVGPPALMVLKLMEACPARFPRRAGIPAKRPLWQLS